MMIDAHVKWTGCMNAGTDKYVITIPEKVDRSNPAQSKKAG